jgi:hypothetical protein
MSLLLTIGCTSVVSVLHEEESIVRAAEKLALSADFVVKTKNGETHTFWQRGASIIDDGGKRWITERDTKKISMADVQSILTDRGLLITLGKTATVEFPAGRWKFLVNEGVLDSISGAGIKTDKTTDEDQAGIFTASLIDVSDMSVWEINPIETISLVAGIILIGGLVLLSVAFSSMEFNLRI